MENGEVRTGQVSYVNSANLTARVKYLNEEIISCDLKIIQNGSDWIPKINDFVLCIITSDADDGFIIGGF